MKDAAQRRDRRIIKTGMVGIVVQALNYVGRLVLIPLSIRMLGMEGYGFWLVVGSVVAWGGISDLGLAPGLVNVVAGAEGRGDRLQMRRAISTGLAAYGVLAMSIALVMVVLSQWPRLATLLGVRDAAMAGDAHMVLLVCGIFLAASILTRVISTTASALQEGYLGSYCQFAGSMIVLATLFILAQRGCGIVGYALAANIPPLLMELGLGVYLFGWRHPDLRPGWVWCSRESLAQLWGFAGPLTLLQFSSIAGLYTANLIIGNRLGAAAVPTYSVPYALFAAMTGTIWLIVSPFLPAFAEATGRGDWRWVRKRAAQLFALGGGVAVAGGLVLVLGGNTFLRLWTSGKVQAGSDLLLALMVFAALDVSTAINGVFLQAIGIVRLLAATYCCVSLAAIAAAWLLLPVMGVVAIPVVGAFGGGLKLALTLPWARGRMAPARHSEG